MGRFRDLTGQRFGRLTVIERAEDQVSDKGKHQTMWLCECDCGNKSIVRASHLTDGRIQSCGCYRYDAVFNDLVGKRFGRLVVLERAESKILSNGNIKTMWLCRCDCGNTSVVRADSLMGGKTTSCGCYLRERQIKHGGYKDRLYHVWHNMKDRCERPKNTNYKNYGGRGIKVCDEWREYANFREWAYANGYDENAPFGDCTLDREDVNGNYEPSNCRWVDLKVQENNRRNSRKENK